jgi:hypothetical protein
MFQNYKVVMTDCGTPYGAEVYISDNEVNMFDGRYLMQKGKPIQLIKPGMLKEYVGKYITIRNPNQCNAGGEQGGTTVCNICIGEAIANSSVGIPAIMTLGISTFLSLFMMLIHAQTLRTTRFTLDRIS